MHGLPGGLLHPWPGFTLCSPAVPPFQGQEARLLLVRGQVWAAASRLRRPGERRHSLLQHGQQVDAAHHVHRGAGPRGHSGVSGEAEQTPQEGASSLRETGPGVKIVSGTWSPLEDLGLGPVHGHTHAHREVRQPAFGCRRLVLTGRLLETTRTCERNVLPTHKCGWFFSVKRNRYFDSL